MATIAPASPHALPYGELLSVPQMTAFLTDVLDKEEFGSGWSLRLLDVQITAPRMAETTARSRGTTLYTWVSAKLELRHAERGDVAHDGLVFRVPSITDRGTFIIGGLDYTPIAQLVPRPGLVFRSTVAPSGLARVVRGDIVPEQGSWIRAVARLDYSDGLTVPDTESSQPLMVRLVFLDREEPRRNAGSSSQDAADVRRGATGRKKLRRRQRDTRSVVEEWSEHDALRSTRLGEEGRRRFNEAIEAALQTQHPIFDPMLTPDDIQALEAAVRKLATGARDEYQALSEELSDLARFRTLTIADQLRMRLRTALATASAIAQRQLEAQAKSSDPIGAEETIRLFTRFAQAATALHTAAGAPAGVAEVPGTFYRVRSAFADRRLVQLLDQTNPLADLSHRRKVTRRGPGGINAPYGAHADRDLHSTHRRRLCPFETPESENIGFNLHLSRGATVRNGSIDPTSQQVPGDWLGWSASLVPFLPHNDATRVLMAAKNMKQAVPLCAPEVPLIATGAEAEIADAAGAVLRTAVEGTVESLDNDPRRGLVTVRVGAIDAFGRKRLHAYEIPTELPGPTGTPAGFARVLVRAGQHVGEGEILAEHASVTRGALSLGCNLRVGYMPFWGFNFEDGIVVSKSAAEKLTSRHLVRVVIELKQNEILWAGSREPSARQRRPGWLDLNGIVRSGQQVAVGDELARGYLLGRVDRRPTASAPSLIWQGTRREYRMRQHRARPGETGCVCNVRVTGAERGGARIEIWLSSERPLGVGDKLMGRHGNKGVVTTILPDDQMPAIPGIGNLEVVLSPVGTLTRMNLGQLVETHLGWVAMHGDEKTKSELPAHWPALSRIDGAQLRGWLRASQVVDETGKAQVHLPKSDQPTPHGVVVGYQYLMKLNHLADEKLAFRTVGLPQDVGAYGRMSFQPLRGRRVGGGQRLGEMEMWALEAWHVPDLLQESVAARSDDLAVRRRLRRLVDRSLADEPADLSTHITESWRAYLMYLLGAGIHARLVAETLGGNSRIAHWLGTVDESKADDLSRVDLSLVTDEILSEIVLAQERVPTTTIRAAADSKLRLRSWVVTEPSSYSDAAKTKHRRRTVAEDGIRIPISGGLADPVIWGEAGGPEPRHHIGLIDLGEPLPHPLTGNPVRFVPVLPPYLRTARLERLYVRLLRLLKTRNGTWKRGKAVPHENDDRTISAIGRAFERLIVEGFVAALGGKTGLLRQRLLGKRVDLSGRAVIVPDPDLRLDECGVPLTVATRLMRTTQSGPKSVGTEPDLKSIQEHLDTNKIVIILNRAPSLHRYNVQAFRPRVRADDVIAMHPALCGRFNADFDGDTMALHIPAASSTRSRAFTIMRPSANLRSSAAGQPLVHLEQDALAGLGVLALTDPDAFKATFEQAPSHLNDVGSLAREWSALSGSRVETAARLGFEHATRFGLSAGWFDLPDFADRSNELKGEGLRSAVSGWLDEKLRSATGSTGLAILVRSGALRDPSKGIELLIQLAARRGAFQKLGGGLTSEVVGCLKTGLTETEIFETAFGARKSLADKKLTTPVAGALTRQLVWAAEGLVVRGDDCETGSAIAPIDLVKAGRVLLTALQWSEGRTLVGARGGTESDIQIRSPLTCATLVDGHVCRRCYGVDPASGLAPVDGWPAGLIAATTVGERGTQLAMRTFHSGGTSSFELTEGLPRVCSLFAGRSARVVLRAGVDDWSAIALTGRAEGLEDGARSRRVAEVTDSNELARIFMFEMFGNYKAGDIRPIHFEVILAALRDASGRVRSPREAAQQRVGPLGAIGFGHAESVIQRLVADLQQRVTNQERLELPIQDPTMVRMLGRRN